MEETMITDMIDKVKKCEQEIGKGIVGQREVIRQVLLAILADGNVLLEGVPGLGKLNLLRQYRRCLRCSFPESSLHRILCLRM